MMGRRKGRRRLADLVFKMADEIMADGGEILNLENRPFHPFSFLYHLPITPRASLSHASLVPRLSLRRVSHVLPRETIGDESALPQF